MILKNKKWIRDRVTRLIILNKILDLKESQKEQLPHKILKKESRLVLSSHYSIVNKFKIQILTLVTYSM